VRWRARLPSRIIAERARGIPRARVLSAWPDGGNGCALVERLLGDAAAADGRGGAGPAD
jgi:hypothetical protein